MNKNELEHIVNELQLQRGIEKGVRMRCAAFWGFMMTAIGMAGAWAVNHAPALDSGFRAFIEAMRKE
jgi:hypothetical protein